MNTIGSKRTYSDYLCQILIHWKINKQIDVQMFYDFFAKSTTPAQGSVVQGCGGYYVSRALTSLQRSYEQVQSSIMVRTRGHWRLGCC